MKVEILGKPYAILEIDASSAPDFSGTNRRDAQTITLVKGQGREARDDALLHESLHIVNDELCIGLTEENIGRLACGLYSAGCRIAVKK